jgi:hypothetical protein
MRARISLTPFLAPPALARRRRYFLGALCLLGLAGAGGSLLRSIERIRAGEPIYGHLLISLFAVAYLVYLLIKLYLLPPIER